MGAMHDKLWDDRHVEVFPSNAPYVQHEVFLKVEPVLKVLHGTKDLSSRGKLQKRRGSATWCELANMEGVGDWEVSPESGPARVTLARVAVRAQVTLLDASSFGQASRSKQNAPVKIPPPDVSGNPWCMFSAGARRVPTMNG